MRLWVCLGTAVLLSACGEETRSAAGEDVLILELGGQGQSLRLSLLLSGQTAVSQEAAEPAAEVTSPRAAAKESRGPRSSPPEPPPQPEYYTVFLQKGETLYGLAAARLGSGSRWRELLPLNGWTEEQATSLRVGTAVKFPIR